MTYIEIMKLLDAGFNRDEIMAMQNDENTEQNNDSDNESGSGENSENSENLNSAITEALAEVKSTFDELKKEFTAMNIMNSRIDNTDKSADDILANIINPFETIDK